MLDRAGDVVGQASAANVIARPSVSLEPVRAFLAAGLRTFPMRPLLGDDPLDPGTRRPFSAHPLSDAAGETIGYVYAVLGGRRHATLLQRVRSSHSLRGVVWTLGGALALAVVGGTLVAFTLTRRLRELTARARRWEREHGAPAGIGAGEPLAPARGGGDEIDGLARAWEAMSARLHEQYRALERVERERRELVAGVSHDLRTPLTMLQGYLETVLMRRGEMAAGDEQRCLETALRQSHRLERLIADLFELSRLDAGERTLEPERFAIAELAQDALQDFEAAAGRAGATLALHVVEGEAPEVNADIALVQRVLDNLLDNALRHVRPGGRVQIEIHPTHDGRVRVAVVDDGVGMSSETLAHATAPGYRGGEAGGVGGGVESRRHAGLGLAIVRGIVTLHGGTLDVASRPGRGSTFAFTLGGADSRVEPLEPDPRAEGRGLAAPSPLHA